MTAELDEVRKAARYHKERYELYRAKVVTGRRSSPTRLRELKRAYEQAEARLEHAVSSMPTDPSPGER